jgi:hypothetical protein
VVWLRHQGGGTTGAALCDTPPADFDPPEAATRYHFVHLVSGLVRNDS